MKNKKEQITEEILDAASRRFGHYGYSKTTMAEIASDCSMSAANLYRYFRDKSAIGTGIARRCFKKELQLLNEVAARTDITQEEKLGEVVLTSIRYNFTEFEDTPRIMELVEHICADGQELIEEHRNGAVGVVVKILQEGVATGEFEIENIEETAVAIRVATLVFHAAPLFLMFKNFCHTQDEMEAMAEKVTRLLIKGIARKQKKA
ncbi:MAG: TetR/AcrR family transcriptional regulator [Proteobacteria bacterium]|nr:TetR/AcrR family transcriptional regulator [Pseudomonadota bacterium]